MYVDVFLLKCFNAVAVQKYVYFWGWVQLNGGSETPYFTVVTCPTLYCDYQAIPRVKQEDRFDCSFLNRCLFSEFLSASILVRSLLACRALYCDYQAIPCVKQEDGFDGSILDCRLFSESLLFLIGVETEDLSYLCEPLIFIIY